MWGRVGLVGMLLVAASACTEHAPVANAPSSSPSLTKSLAASPKPASPPAHVVACTKDGLEVRAGTRHPGDTEDIGVLITLKNVGEQACLLTGTPNVVLHGAGVQDLKAPADPATGTYPRPLLKPLGIGQTAITRINVSTACASNFKENYSAASLTLPSGDEITIVGLNLMVGCGAAISAFYLG